MELFYLSYKDIFKNNSSLVSNVKLSPFIYWVKSPLVISLDKLQFFGSGSPGITAVITFDIFILSLLSWTSIYVTFPIIVGVTEV